MTVDHRDGASRVECLSTLVCTLVYGEMHFIPTREYMQCSTKVPLPAQNLPNALAALFLATRSTLNRTVLDNGRHCPDPPQQTPSLVQSQLTNGHRVTNLYTKCR